MPQRMARFGVPQRLPRAAQLALSAGFLLLLALPAALFGRGAAPEAAKTAPLPPLSWAGLRSFPRAFERSFDKRFGLRGPLVRLHNVLRVSALGSSPLPEIVLGRSGWLFYDGERVGDGLTLSDFRGEAPYPPNTAANVAAKVAHQAAWLGERGIRYAVLVAPNKETIYAEHLPAWAGPRGRSTRLDELAAACAGAGAPLVDPRGALSAAKALGPLYYRTDSHWTALGALVAYRELVERLREAEPRLAPVRLDEYAVRLDPESGRPGDLRLMLSLPGRTREWDAAVAPRDPAWPGERKLGKVLLFRDSFGEYLPPYLARHFRETVAVVGPLDFRKVEEERPDVVIFEAAERYLRAVQKSVEPPAAPGPDEGGGTLRPAPPAGPGPSRAERGPLRRDGAAPRG